MNELVKKQIVFRFDASIKIGAGHAIRSMVLASRFKELNWNVFIATNSDSYNFISALNAFQRIDPNGLLDGTFFCDILVVDSYEIDENLESQFRKYAKKIIVIDDLANRSHDCDILIDQTFGRAESDYKNLVPHTCKILTGSDFALIRDGFLKYRVHVIEKRINTHKINTVLISLGGWDQKRLTKEVLKRLIDTGYEGEIDIVIGFTNNSEENLLNYIKKLPNLVNLHVNPDMAKLMFKADFGITGAGSSVWERSCLGLPGIIINVAENQSLIYKLLIDNHFFYCMSELNAQLKNKFLSYRSLFNLCDGRGKDRLIEKIEAWNG